MSSEITAPAQLRRMFFALWPTDALRTQIGLAVRPIIEGRTARAIPLPNLHITLSFLGFLSATEVASAIEAGSQITGDSFAITIDRMETWQRAQVACLTIEPAPAPLATLVERLRFSLLARHVAADQKEFKAHVTIAREWRDRPLDASVGPFVWPVSEFVLVESNAGRNGSEYTIVQRWPLAGSHP